MDASNESIPRAQMREKNITYKYNCRQRAWPPST